MAVTTWNEDSTASRSGPLTELHFFQGGLVSHSFSSTPSYVAHGLASLRKDSVECVSLGQSIKDGTFSMLRQRKPLRRALPSIGGQTTSVPSSSGRATFETQPLSHPILHEFVNEAGNIQVSFASIGRIL